VVGLGHVTRAGYKQYIILSPFLVSFKWKPHRDCSSTSFITMIKDYRQPLTNSTPANSTFPSEQTNHSNQPTVFFSQNKLATSHQPNEYALCKEHTCIHTSFYLKSSI
jgi:hypothetical protein